jgi:hypothetical protein
MPELARVDPEAAAEVVRTVRRRHARGHLGSLLLGALLGLVPAFIWWWWALPMLDEAMSAAPARARLLTWGYWGMGAAMMLAGAWIVRNEWLRSTVRKALASDRCLRCRYSLLGLTAPDGWLSCPECGLRVPLSMTGMTLSRVEGEPDARTAIRFIPDEGEDE